MHSTLSNSNVKCELPTQLTSQDMLPADLRDQQGHLVSLDTSSTADLSTYCLANVDMESQGDVVALWCLFLAQQSPVLRWLHPQHNCTSSLKHPAEVPALPCEPVHQTHPPWDTGQQLLGEKNGAGLSAALTAQNNCPSSFNAWDWPKVMTVEQKHIWQFSSSFYFGLNNAGLVLLVDTHTLQLASPLSIKPLNLETVLPSHQGSSSASCICRTPSLPASSALLSLSLTLTAEHPEVCPSGGWYTE